MTRDITAARPRKTAQGAAARAPLTLYRLFWLFLIAGVLGDFIEVAFWLATRGELTSRSSLLYGPFSMSAARIFMTGAVLGGVYEYICSLIQEVFFGASFWDYRHLPLNLNGRINLVFCLFWGGAAVVWVRLACPALSRFIERIPRLRGRRIAIAAALFLTFSALLSACALGRMGQRQQGVPASGAVARFLDENYPDGALYSRYPNMKLCAGLD